MILRALILICLIACLSVSSASAALPLTSEPEPVAVYHPVIWEDGPYLMPVTHWIPADPCPGERVRATLQLLLDLQSGLLPGIRLGEVAVDGGEVTVDLIREPTAPNLGSWTELVAVQSIVQTALGSGLSGPVHLTVDGRSALTLAGHTDISGPLEADPTVLWRGFDDTVGHWAERQVLALSLAGAVRGRTPTTFGPEHPMSRGDFILALVQARPPFILTGHPDEGWAFGDPFPEVNPETELGRAVRMACAAGYLHSDDYPDGLAPEEPLTRGEAALIALRALGDRVSGGQDWIEAARKVSLLRGYADGSLRLEQHLTRAEAAALIARARDFCPAGAGVAVILPAQEAVLTPGEPVMGVTAAGGGEITYQLHLHDGEFVCGGTVGIDERGLFVFCPDLSRTVAGPAQLTVEGLMLPLILQP
ncbi:MAG: S-layer homology domain-containing protein [Bacillota bacterium]